SANAQGSVMNASGLKDFAPTGSRWYYLGEHWEVVSQSVHDDEPAVACKIISRGKGKRQVLHHFTLRQLHHAAARDRAVRMHGDRCDRNGIDAQVWIDA